MAAQGRAEDFTITGLNGHPAFAANAPEFSTFLDESDEHLIWR